MKKYIDYLNEITDAELYDGLLGYGLFSEMIPPFLCSDLFLKYCKEKIHSKEDIEGEKRNPQSAQYIEYYSMRNINVPRIIGIPSPLHYEKLCLILSENWGSIKKHFEKQTEYDKYKISQIHIRKISSSNAIFKMNYNNWKDDGDSRIDLLRDNKYLVQADISNCFGSIYTHAIPWALISKEKAKKENKNERKNEWYNKIDKAARDCKNGETNGLLIGPHASNVLSEIVLTSIDHSLAGKWNYIRNIDDYTCFVKTKDQASRFLVELSSELKKYNLTLNYKKTAVKELPVVLTKRWVNELDNISIYYRNNHFDYKSIKAYLDNAIELMAQNENDAAILNYAIKCVPKNMSNNAIEYFVKYVLHLCMLYPYLLRIVDKYVFQKFAVENPIIVDFVNNVLSDSIEKHNFDGVSWSLYFAIKYKINVDIDVDWFIKNEDCISSLLAYIYCKKNELSNGTEKLCDYAKKIYETPESFYENWVFVYEVLSEKELEKHERKWSNLKKNNVSFLVKEFR